MRYFSFSLLLSYLICPTEAFANLYQWTDNAGVVHIVDESVEVPTEFRDLVKVYRTRRASSSEKTLLPARSFAENTQGSFAQKLARDLGLIEREDEDALSALTGAGVSPAGGWKVYDPLSREAAHEVIASARRAAESRRLSLSADGAEGVVRQALGPFILAGAPRADFARSGYREDEYHNGEPTVVEYRQEVIEVVPQPVYIPFPLVVVNSHHRSSRLKRFRHHRSGVSDRRLGPKLSKALVGERSKRSLRSKQPSRPPDAFAASPFSSSRFINKRSSRPLFSTPPLRLHQSSPLPFASPHPGIRR